MLVGVIPDPDFAAEFFRPCPDFFIIKLFLRGIPFRPGTRFRHHDHDVIRNVHRGNAAVGTVSHHRNDSRNPLFLQPVRNGNRIAPDQFRGIMRIVLPVCRLALFTSASAERILRHDVHISPPACIDAPRITAVPPCRRNFADIGLFPFQIGTDILINLLHDSAGVAELSGVPDRRIIAPFAVALERKILRMRFPEPLNVPEMIEPVTTRQILRFQAQTVIVQSLRGIDDRIAVLPLEIGSVPECGNLALGEIRTVVNTHFRYGKAVRLRDNGSQLAGEIHPHPRHTFQKVVNAEQRAALVKLAPDAAACKRPFRVCLRIVQPRNINPGAVRFYDESVADKFRRINPCFLRPRVDSENERDLPV